ncbi:helix-turn-helix domain-containing protein [Brucella anthropi]|uniref:helix-turn-helix domain-containing protein n=1 Tax=Brucella anthropi TaxID=529 RepID=UPI0021024C76|nr:LysR family transcriptional regulator [Brucella anthropi]
MNLDRSALADLNIFVTIVRRKSMKLAAIELGVTTSAISHRMKNRVCPEAWLPMPTK